MRLKWFKKINPPIQILIFLGLLFILLAFYIPVAKYLKPPIISSLSLPLKLCQGFSSNARHFLSFQDLSEENKRLKRKGDQLNAQLGQLQELAQENVRLRELLSLPQRKSFRTQAALLIGTDSSNWTRIVMINKGRQDGVKKGMPVILGGNLVGKVIEDAAHVSKVALVVDFSTKIPAKIMRTREEGVVFGTVVQGANACKMKYVQQVQIGDEVISSGLGQIYPKGFLIGKVVAVEEKKNRLYKVAEIQPAVNFSSLEEVMVITSQ